MGILILLAVLWGHGDRVQAQTGKGAERFDVYQAGQDIVLEVVLQGGYTCNGIRFLRRRDQEDYQDIGYIPGICGSDSFPVPYTWRDSMPPPFVPLHYVAVFGAQDTTPVRTVIRWDTGQEGIHVYPNPARSTVRVCGDLADTGPLVCRVVDPHGKEMMTWQGFGPCPEWEVGAWPPGSYLVLWDQGGRRRTGKLLVLP